MKQKITKSLLKKIIKEEIQILKEAQYSLGGGGMKKLGDEKILILPNTEYYMGASSSPDRILVKAIDDNFITFSSYPFKKYRKIETPIGKHLIQTGTEAFIKLRGKYFPEESKSFKANLAGKKGSRTGKTKPSDVERVTVKIWGKDGGNDLYKIGKSWGVVSKWNEGDNTIEVDTERRNVKDMKKDSNIAKLKLI